uniref:PucR family transcriptional regulator n=1 Tax=Vaginimicrobium propionicum TaxID=1871034 RepID=UPI0009713802|nr:helix-turn-helix domain-containing protein [Vaginimicrobium propionicum]
MGTAVTGAAIISSGKQRSQMAKRLHAVAGKMTTAAVRDIESQHPWFLRLGANERSWVRVVVVNGIEGFIDWFEGKQEINPADLFNAAPRVLTRRITLDQTVDLIRTTIEAVETQIGELLPKSDRLPLTTATVYFSREVAFASAKVYAHAAERRGNWDQRMEALVVDAIVRGDSADSLLSRASALGWIDGKVAVAVSPLPDDLDLEIIRQTARQEGQDILAASHGDRLVILIPDSESKQEKTRLARQTMNKLATKLGAGRIVIGPTVEGIEQASISAQAALSGARAEQAWPEGPRIVDALELLPERALAGNGQARRELVLDVYQPLISAGGDLLETCVTFLNNYGSIEASARALFVHANTVRYRLKRIQEVTGYAPGVARDSFVLRLAITLGRLGENDPSQTF